MAKQPQQQQPKPAKIELKPAASTETQGKPEPVVVPKAETQTVANTGIGGSPLAAPPRGFFGKPPSPGGIGHGNAR